MTHSEPAHSTLENTIEIATLKTELKAAKERLEDVSKDRDEWKGQAKTLSILLTDQRPLGPEPEHKPHKGLLGRLADAVKG